jgi:hypothetical protein
MYTKSTIDKKFFNNLVLPYVSTLQGGAKEVSAGKKMEIGRRLRGNDL